MSKKQASSKKAIPFHPDRAEAVTGTKSPVLQYRLIREVCETLWLPKELDEEEQHNRILAAIERLETIKPQDGVERMLAVQMIATHHAALECLRRAMLENQTFVGRDMALKHATKLLQVYERQVAALNKHRGKGQQKVTVEHVHVEAGGQAIVGNVDARGDGGRRGTHRGGQTEPSLTDEPGISFDTIEPPVERVLVNRRKRR